MNALLDILDDILPFIFSSVFIYLTFVHMDNIPLANVIDKADYVRPSIPSALLSHTSLNNNYTPFEVLILSFFSFIILLLFLQFFNFLYLDSNDLRHNRRRKNIPLFFIFLVFLLFLVVFLFQFNLVLFLLFDFAQVLLQHAGWLPQVLSEKQIEQKQKDNEGEYYTGLNVGGIYYFSSPLFFSSLLFSSLLPFTPLTLFF